MRSCRSRWPGRTESLNASVAAGVVLAEIARQRTAARPPNSWMPSHRPSTATTNVTGTVHAPTRLNSANPAGRPSR